MENTGLVHYPGSGYDIPGKPVENRTTCEYCMYFMDCRMPNTKPGEGTGECRRFPPMPNGNWCSPSTVSPSYWCGEWKGRVD